MRFRSLAILVCVVLTVTAGARVNPRLKDVRKITVVPILGSIGRDHGGKIVSMYYKSPEEVRDKIMAAIVTSGRFAAVERAEDADAEIEGTAGYIKSEKDGKKYTTGFAHLKLVSTKDKEVLWTFDYEREPGVQGRAVDRVANQFIEKLLADAKIADGQ